MQNNLKYIFVFSVILLLAHNSNAQLKENNKWKALIGIGLNQPFNDGFVDGVKAKPQNLPTVNLGIQHMLKRHYGVRLDFGFNRFKNDESSPEFKINYTRLNAQFVYNPSDYIGFLPTRLQTFLHAGPGITFVKPLGGLDKNKQSYPNINFGLELHYEINDKVAIYTDIAYLYGLTSLEDYNPTLNGLGAFNGNLLNLTFGVAISLSGCQYCN